jgi:uncharacterized Tic20 family protein
MTSKPTQTAPGVSPAAEGPGVQGVTGDDGRVRDGEVTWATFGYLGAAFLGPVIPLVIYLVKGGKSPFLRYHAATAANLSLTGVLYALCCAIVGGLLLLDSVTAALVIALPLGFAMWVLLLRNLIRGAIAASRGEELEVAAWICARLVR